MKLRPGKLAPAVLQDLLALNVILDDRVVIRPAIGEDVCAIRMGTGYLVAKTDPVTFATDRIGWYVVHVNANDIATAGALPRWFLLTALLPETNADQPLVQCIWNDVQKALREVGCVLCGGHSEVTVGLQRPILVGHMLGEVPEGQLIDKRSVRPGDRILLTKGVPIEGTALMAYEYAGELERAFDKATIATARAFLEEPGLSVLPEARIACEAGQVHAMHDPTEGGVATGLWELAQASGCGMLVHADRIPILEPGGAFCRHFGLDPLGVISSGTLLICAPPREAEHIASAIRSNGIPCTDIGEIRPRQEGIMMTRGAGPEPMPIFPQDEITRLFAEQQS